MCNFVVVGLEQSGDSYPNGGPDKIDPFEAARNLVKNEIIVYSVGCEPAINGYKFARDFMKSIADMSGMCLWSPWIS